MRRRDVLKLPLILLGLVQPVQAKVTYEEWHRKHPDFVYRDGIWYWYGELYSDGRSK